MILQYLLICSAAFITSGLTLLSGFGLGTLLLPAFAVFFPVDLAVALTAIVHLLNNLFKLVLLGKYADWGTVIRFGLPAIIAAFLGAWVLLWFSDLPPLGHHRMFGREFEIALVKLVIGILMIVFALMEMVPGWQRTSFSQRYLPVGGLLSGFFGGLSGHQGALRSAFLIRTGLSKESYLGTSIVIACLVDLSRMVVYSARFFTTDMGGDVAANAPLLVAAVLSAFLGALLGNRLMRKVTFRSIQILVSVLLFGIALGLISGML